jgi:DNA ligase (NAD+)
MSKIKEYVKEVQENTYDPLASNGYIKGRTLYLIRKQILGDIDQSDIDEINDIIELTNFIYNNTDLDSPISDEEYDTLYEIFISDGNSSIGAKVNNQDVGLHLYPELRGTLDKIHFLRESDKPKGEVRKSLDWWINSISSKVNYVDDLEIMITPKLDGVSIIFEFDENCMLVRALTRGDVSTNEGMDVTELFKGLTMRTFEPDKKKPFGVKTEIIMTESNYKDIQKLKVFKSPRSAVSSIINGLDREFIEYLNPVVLSYKYEGERAVLNNGIFDVFPKLAKNKHIDFGPYKLTEIDTIECAIDDIQEEMYKVGIPIDGVVLSIVDKDLQQVIGRSDHINKYEIAYKFKPEKKKAILKNVNFSMGPLGGIMPVAEIKPVKINYNTITNISLGSMDRFNELDLHYGEVVEISYDIIPYLDKVKDQDVSGMEKILPPTKCSCCGEELVNKPNLKCVNPLCEGNRKGIIYNYVTKMNIPNISIGTIVRLYDEGIISGINGLYKISKYKDVIINMDGFGKKSYQRIIDGIDSRREVYDYELLGSLGIASIGRRIFKKIMSIYNINELVVLCNKENWIELTKIEGIQENTAKKIIEGINDNLGIIEFLMKELKVIHDNKTYDSKVLFTKVRDKEFESYLSNNNVLVLDSYSKDVDYVITLDSLPSSTKTVKAIKDGKEVIGITEAKQKFGYNA